MSGKSEYSPLSGADLLPKRLESGEMQSCERYIAYATMLLAACSAIVCIAFGVKEHIQHVIMGAVIALVGVQFFYICRLYKNDVLQDRKVVYLSAVVTIAVCAAGLIYATSWKNADPYHGCRASYFSAETDSCLKFTTPIQHNRCYVVSGSTIQYSATMLPNSFNATLATCDNVQRWITSCTGQQPKWDCPK